MTFSLVFWCGLNLAMAMCGPVAALRPFNLAAAFVSGVLALYRLRRSDQ